MTEEYSTGDLVRNSPAFRASVAHLRDEIKLGEAWRDILAGRVTAEQAKMVMTDLVLETEYYAVAPEDASDRSLQRREGKRAIMARILFLADMPSSFITKLRRDALDELQKLEERAQNG